MTARLRIVGDDGSRLAVVEMILAHGADPMTELAQAGWHTLSPAGISTVSAPHEITLRYLVEPLRERTSRDSGCPGPLGPVTDAALVIHPGEEAVAHQRAAAYGVITSPLGVLLTQLSKCTNAAGWWNLPGGGIDPGESPQEALVREVTEETGQSAEGLRLIETVTSHWVGRAPSGRLEDFHAVRIVFAAHCPEPTRPVVHDVGGSTSAAAWVLPEELECYPLAGFVAEHLHAWLAR